MSIDASPGDLAMIRRVRWYHLPIPLAASLALSLAVALVWLVWQAVSQGGFDPAAFTRLTQDFTFLSIVQASAGLGLLLPSLWFLSRITDPGLPLRFRAPSVRDVLTGLGIAVALMLVASLFEYSCDAVLGTHLMEDTARLPITPRTLAQVPLGILVIAVLAPLSEEAFFRGLVLGWLHRHWGRWPAILGSSLVFGLVHLKWLDPAGLGGWLLTAELSAVGVVLALVALRTGNLWASVATHALNNLAALLLTFFFLAGA
jgi:membrane protease YdiL (CAAX protease family)